MKKIFIGALLINMVLISTLYAGEKKPINILFVGNSFTGMHAIPFLTKQLIESGKPDVEIDYLTALSGGKTLEWHWKAENYCYLNLPKFSREALESSCAELEIAMKSKNSQKGKKTENDIKIPYRQRITNYKKWLEWMKVSEKPKLDYVSLSPGRRDEEGGLESSYANYARK